MDCLIGVDIGTTGAKTILMDSNGRQLASATEEYPLSNPHPKWSEQDPERWVQAALNTIRDALRKADLSAQNVKGVGFSGQMHGLVLLDEAGGVLRPAILWNDVRTTEQCREIESVVGRETLFQETCNPALEGFTAPKVLWVCQHEPEIYERARHILLPKDYVRYRLTGELAMEASDAAGTLLYNVRERRWSKPVLDALQIPTEWMPPAYESSDICGRATKETAEKTGLPEGTPFVGGGADNACAAVGNGIVVEGKAAASLGTSGVVLAHTDKPLVDPDMRAHTFCHAVPDRWYSMGVMLSAGGAFRWLRDALCQEEAAQAEKSGADAYDVMSQKAAEAPVGSEGLIFLPYLTGERTPYPDANAKAAFVGLTLRHGKGEIIRAAMEGITYGMRDSLEIIRDLGVEVTEILATGGGGKSAFWRQMQADIYEAEVTAAAQSEGPAFGAAILAGVGSGVFGSCEEAAEALINIESRTQPNPDVRDAYRRGYSVYRSLYPALKPSFDAISSMVEEAAG